MLDIKRDNIGVLPLNIGKKYLDMIDEIIANSSLSKSENRSRFILFIKNNPILLKFASDVAVIKFKRILEN